MEDRDLFNRLRVDEFWDKFSKFLDHESESGRRKLKYSEESVKSLDPDSVCNFYFDILELMCDVNKVRSDPPLINKYFSNEDILRITIDSDRHVGTSIKHVADSIIPEYDFYHSIHLSSWHFDMSGALSYSECRTIYDKLNNMPLPNDDERFSIKPLYTNALRFNSKFVGGMTALECLQGEKRGFRKDSDGNVVPKSEEFENRVFIDGKVGFMVYFKGMPSMLVSFNFDTDKNLYIKQIQAQLKSRGHYKLGDDWRVKMIDLVKDQFSEYTVHLATGQEVVNDILIQYQNSGDDVKPPPTEVLSRIEGEYDKLQEHYQTRKNPRKSGFRRIS